MESLCSEPSTEVTIVPENAHLSANGTIDNPLVVSTDHALPLGPPATAPLRLRQALMRQHWISRLPVDDSPQAGL